MIAAGCGGIPLGSEHSGGQAGLIWAQGQFVLQSKSLINKPRAINQMQSVIAESYDKNMFIFVRICQTVFQSNSIIGNSLSNEQTFLLLWTLPAIGSVLWNLIFVIGVQLCLGLLLICNFLRKNSSKDFSYSIWVFAYLLSSYLLSWSVF